MRITLEITDTLDEGENWDGLMATISEEDADKAMLHVGGYALGGRIATWTEDD